MNATTKAVIAKQSLKSEPEDDVAPAPAPASKPGLLPTGLSRAIVMAAVLLAIAVTPALFTRRYEMTVVPQSGSAMAFRLDTLTGGVSLCTAGHCAPVVEKTGGQ